jgi:hypothetical protein
VGCFRIKAEEEGAEESIHYGTLKTQKS